MFPLLNSRHLSVSFTFLCSFTEWTSVHLCLQTCGHTRAHQCPFRQSLCCLSMLTMHVLLCTSYFQHAGTPLQLLPSTPSTSPPLPPCLFFTTGAIHAHLFVTFSSNERGVHGGQAPMGQLFHRYKTFEDSLQGCTFCRSRAPRGEQQPRERERERGGKERESVNAQGVASF